MSLKESYQFCFKMGAAIPRQVLKDEPVLRHIAQEYDSITCENDMKPENLLDAEANRKEPERYERSPAVTFEKIDPYMEYAKKNGIGMRGHTLVWHNQTPRWFFAKDYRNEEDAPLADRETMLARMESYIRTVMTYVQQKWPGVIYAWDVVNEAVVEEGLRESFWTGTVGQDFVLQAFRFARKYSDGSAALFYNDYDTFLPWKREAIYDLILRPLLEEGLVDGMGMQTHLTMETDLGEYEKSLRYYGALPLQVQITELDIHNTDPSEESMERLAQRYESLFDQLVKARKDKAADLTGVTFWGLQDDMSWLTAFRKERSYPLLFDGQLKPKKAYYAVLGAAEK